MGCVYRGGCFQVQVQRLEKVIYETIYAVLVGNRMVEGQEELVEGEELEPEKGTVEGIETSFVEGS